MYLCKSQEGLCKCLKSKPSSVPRVLARALPGFRARPVQQHMASRIDAALQARDVLLVEAGTGTGKTYAYLLPVLLSGLRVLISTGTRTLQDQLFHRDLPLLSGAIGRPARVALLKGRSNYLCRARLLGVGQQAELLPAVADSAGHAALAGVLDGRGSAPPGTSRSSPRSPSSIRCERSSAPPVRAAREIAAPSTRAVTCSPRATRRWGRTSWW